MDILLVKALERPAMSFPSNYKDLLERSIRQASILLATVGLYPT